MREVKFAIDSTPSHHITLYRIMESIGYLSVIYHKFVVMKNPCPTTVSSCFSSAKCDLSASVASDLSGGTAADSPARPRASKPVSHPKKITTKLLSHPYSTRKMDQKTLSHPKMILRDFATDLNDYCEAAKNQCPTLQCTWPAQGQALQLNTLHLAFNTLHLFLRGGAGFLQAVE